MRVRTKIARALGWPQRVLPPLPRAAPSSVTGSYGAFLGAVCASTAILTAAVALESPHQPWLIAVFALLGFGSGLCVAQVVPGGSYWAPDAFFTFAAAFILGPVGAVVCALSETMGFAVRRRPYWAHWVFNVATTVLPGLAGWTAFHWALVSKVPGSPVTAALCAGLVYALTSQTLYMADVSFEENAFAGWGELRELGMSLPTEMAHALAALGATLLYSSQGFMGIVMVGVSVVAFQGFLIYLSIKIHRHTLEIEENHQARVRLLQDAIEASNVERERIASDIHDGVVQDLAGSYFTLAAYGDLKPGTMSAEEQREVLDILHETTDVTQRAAGDLRTLMVEIAPPKLKEHGLAAALEDMLSHKARGVCARIAIDSNVDAGDKQNALIYRVAQEAVRNCVKYAKAANIIITVELEGDWITLCVRDDGRGFSVEEWERRQSEGHVGLKLLRRTVEDGGGTLAIESSPGHGTAVIMKVPHAVSRPAS